MRINHNIQALNAYRNLSRNSTDMSKHLERLSSGLRINRAADDAAGLAISEKMRSQIRGLDMADRNTMDGISLIQTAEGALGTTHEILQRMRELAVQSANGTLEDQDRSAIQSEIDQLTQELDRIARTTQFNSKSLLRGSADSKAFASSSTPLTYAGNGTWGGVVSADPSAPGTADLTLNNAFGAATSASVDAQTFTVNGKTYELQTNATPVTAGNIAVPVTWTGAAENKINNTMQALQNAIQANDPDLIASVKTSAVAAGSSGTLTIQTARLATPATASAVTLSTSLAAADAVFSSPNLIAPATSSMAKSITLTFNSVPKEGDALTIDAKTFVFTTGAAAPPAIAIDPTGMSVSDVLNAVASQLTPTTDLQSASVSGDSLTLTTTATYDGTAGSGLQIQISDKDFTTNSGKDLKINMQIGANAGESMEVSIGVMDAANLGLARQADHKTIIGDAGVDAVAGLDMSSSETAAAAAIDVIDNAIKLVSDERSKLGAYQNRMEHTVDNLGIASENMTSAESRIRDADMASEMTDFTKTNIINQSATAMLAQANQLPQGILQLLK